MWMFKATYKIVNKTPGIPNPKMKLNKYSPPFFISTLIILT